MKILNTQSPYQQNFTGYTFRPTRMRFIHSPENMVSGFSNAQKPQRNIFNRIKNWFKEYFNGYAKRIRYTAVHKKAFLRVEKEFTGKNTLNGYLHDADKLIMYVIGVPKQMAHNIHVATAPHHVRNGKVKNPVQTVIDWECARYTKPDKPLSAREYYENFYVEKQGIRIPEIEEVLEKFGL